MVREMIGGCCVCLDERGWNENPLVYCDGSGCTIAVHQGFFFSLKFASFSFSKDSEIYYEFKNFKNLIYYTAAMEVPGLNH